MTAVLDSWAIIALFRREPAGPRVSELVSSGGGAMSSINLGESLYSTVRRGASLEEATRMVERLRRRVRVEHADWPMVRRAAELKATRRMSYADAFCLATAERLEAPLWTGDPELIACADMVEIVDLR
jgi:PIN domain nuclease of toxin-antitoxin system